MQIKTFKLNVISNDKTEIELNLFLRSHKIYHLEKTFVESGNNSFWAILIQYEHYGDYSTDKTPKIKSKIDYKEKLEPAVFEIFAKLREIRKKIAIENGVAVYVVFTNEELANIALLEEINLQNIQDIKGIGKNRIDKYGKFLVEQYNALK